MESAGVLAPVVFVLLLVAQAILAPLPAPAAAGGYLFGTVVGFFLTWLGALLGGLAVAAYVYYRRNLGSGGS